MYLDLLFAKEPLPQLVNVVHPQPTTWSVVLKGFSDVLGGLPIIPPSEWASRLEQASLHATAQDISNVVRLICSFASEAELIHHVLKARAEAPRILSQLGEFSRPERANRCVAIRHIQASESQPHYPRTASRQR